MPPAKKGSDLHLRPFCLQDAETVSPWLVGPGLSVPPGIAREGWPSRMVADRHILARVAIRHGRIVAFARLDCGPDRIAEVTLVVAPDCRRQGIGREVLSGLLQEARRLRLRRLHAMVDPKGAEAVRFFRDSGFEEDGVLGDRIRFVRLVHASSGQTPLEIDL